MEVVLSKIAGCQHCAEEKKAASRLEKKKLIANVGRITLFTSFLINTEAQLAPHHPFPALIEVYCGFYLKSSVCLKCRVGKSRLN